MTILVSKICFSCVQNRVMKLHIKWANFGFKLYNTSYTNKINVFVGMAKLTNHWKINCQCTEMFTERQSSVHLEANFLRIDGLAACHRPDIWLRATWGHKGSPGAIWPVVTARGAAPADIPFSGSWGYQWSRAFVANRARGRGSTEGVDN